MRVENKMQIKLNPLKSQEYISKETIQIIQEECVLYCP